MAVKYHFNKDTGRTGKCDAKIKCRLGLAESEHFETQDEAKQAYEKTMSNKTTAAVRKQNKNDLSKIKFNVYDIYPYDQDQNLNGKTVSEYRQYIKDNHEKYSGKVDEIKKSVINEIGLPDHTQVDFAYNPHTVTDWDMENIEISISLYGNPFGLDEDDYGYEYNPEILNNVDVSEILNEEYINNENYNHSKAGVEGYYNEEQFVELNYKIPEDSKEDVKGAIDAEKYKKVAKIANDSAFPDWAVLPENITLDKERKEFSNPRFQQRPSYPATKIIALQDKLNPDEVRKDLTKRLDKTKKNVQKLEARIPKVKEIKKSNPGSDKTRNTYSYMTSEWTGDPADLSAKERKLYIVKLEKKLEQRNREIANLETRLNNVHELNSYEKEGTKKGIEKLESEYKEKVAEYTVEKLSRKYPSSNENLRKKKAEEWVNKHPEILNVNWDNYK